MVMAEYLKRLIDLANSFFDVRNDPAQISVDRKVMARLKKIHPGTMMEKSVSKGPVAWTLVIPTTEDLMLKFVGDEINERDLLKKTPLHKKYTTIYLCSALVLPEYRRKGIARRLLIRSIRSIKKDHPINALFYWGFSPAGSRLAKSVARKFGLPLYKRNIPERKKK